MFLLLAGLAQAADTDIGPALEVPKKAKWDAKGKALDPFGRGDTKRRNKDWAPAIDLLLEAIVAQPGCGKCLDSLARTLTGAERFDDAVKVAGFLNETYPDRDEGVLRISEAWAAAQDWEKTVDAAGAVIERDGSDVYQWWLRSDSLRRLGRGDEALELMTGAKDAGLAEGEAACIEIELLAATGDAAAAREKWEACEGAEMVSLKREAEGWMALAEGDVGLAVKRLAMAGGNENLTRLAQAYMRLDEGKPEAALNLANKVLDDDKNTAVWDSWLIKALALSELGKADEAATALAEGPMAEGWADRHAKLASTDVILSARGPEWPQEVGRRAVALKIALLAEDNEAAKALYDEAVAAYGEHPDLTTALEGPAEEADGEGEEPEK